MERTSNKIQVRVRHSHNDPAILFRQVRGDLLADVRTPGWISEDNVKLLAALGVREYNFKVSRSLFPFLIRVKIDFPEDVGFYDAVAEDVIKENLPLLL